MPGSGSATACAVAKAMLQSLLLTATPAVTTLVSITDLATHRDDARWVILDCRHDLLDPGAGRAAVAAGHVPGVRFAAIDTDLSDKTPAADGTFRGRHPLPQRAALLDTLRRWGIDDDARGGMFAARLRWMLRWIGHARVAVLDGGLPAWTAAGLPVTSGAALPPAAPGNLEDRPALTTMVQAQDIFADLGKGKRLVIEARAPDRFRGENETLDPVGGHIPGAKNRFFKDNLQADKRFKPAADLRTAFEKLVGDPTAAIMQCGSGVTACHNLLAMEVAGLSGAALYPGSWSEWCADEARPVATGAA